MTLVHYYSVRCDVCNNLMSTDGRYVRGTQVPGLYQTEQIASDRANLFYWLVTYDDVNQVWSVLCPQDRGGL